MRAFLLASAVTDDEKLEQTVALPAYKVDIDVFERNVMGVSVPGIELHRSGSNSEFPYVFPSVTAEMDVAVEKLNEITEKLLRLAEVEKTCNMLADEIEKNRRRVNALEYVMIPQLEETIKYIVMKLDENERASIVRLMKVKNK